MFALAFLWAVLASAVVVLAVYRKRAARYEDDVIHVQDTQVAMIGKQNSLARTLGVVDRWGKILTIVVVAYGLVLLTSYLYIAWERSQQLNLR
jgi:hypothetical protein